MEGIGKNVRLGKFDMPSIDSFLSDYAKLRSGRRVSCIEPSIDILDIIVAEEFDRQAIGVYGDNQVPQASGGTHGRRQ